MGTNVTLRTKTIGGQLNIFGSTMVRWITGGLTIDADAVNKDSDGHKRLKAGEPLGKITASGLYSPVKYSKLAADADSLDTDITLTDASRFQPGDDIDIDGVAKTIESVNGNVVTLTAAIGVDKATGKIVKAKDGSEAAACMLGEDVDFELDNSGAFGDQIVTAFDFARVIEARIDATIEAQTKTELPGITFV